MTYDPPPHILRAVRRRSGRRAKATERHMSIRLVVVFA
jgi:hypothetical protein